MDELLEMSLLQVCGHWGWECGRGGCYKARWWGKARWAAGRKGGGGGRGAGSRLQLRPAGDVAGGNMLMLLMLLMLLAAVTLVGWGGVG
jgi:hypothetical protein